jgi:hypothetical protein
VPEHAALIALLILERPLCLECIATKAGVSLSEAERYLGLIEKGLSIVTHESRCRTCGEPRTVFSLSRP